METTTFNVPTLSCSACSRKIEESVKELKGIVNVSSDLKSQHINVDYNPSDITPQEIKKHISAMGYEII